MFIYVVCRQGFCASDEDGYSWHYDIPEAAFNTIDKALEYTRSNKPKYPCRCHEDSCIERNGYLIKELAVA